MPFPPGATVVVLSINRRAEVEGEVRPGMYAVRVGALRMTVAESGLRPATTRRAAKAPIADGPPDEAGPEFAPLDLHGLSVADARNRVAGYISRALVAGASRVEIVHGIGTGALKAAVKADLSRIAAVRKVSPHPGNPGVLVVTF